MGNCITNVVNEHTEEKGSQERSLRDIRKNVKRRGKNTRNMSPRFVVR
jgi:hypothetical protein